MIWTQHFVTSHAAKPRWLHSCSGSFLVLFESLHLVFTAPSLRDVFEMWDCEEPQSCVLHIQDDSTEVQLFFYVQIYFPSGQCCMSEYFPSCNTTELPLTWVTDTNMCLTRWNLICAVFLLFVKTHVPFQTAVFRRLWSSGLALGAGWYWWWLFVYSFLMVSQGNTLCSVCCALRWTQNQWNSVGPLWDPDWTDTVTYLQNRINQ